MSLNCVSDCLSTLRFSKGHIFVSQPSFIDREGFCSWCQVIGGDARNGYLDEAWNFLRWLGSETHGRGLKLDARVFFFSVFQGLVNVPFWGFWTSPSNISWKLYPQYLGDVQLGHLPTPLFRRPDVDSEDWNNHPVLIGTGSEWFRYWSAFVRCWSGQDGQDSEKFKPLGYCRYRFYRRPEAVQDDLGLEPCQTWAMAFEYDVQKNQDRNPHPGFISVVLWLSHVGFHSNYSIPFIDYCKHLKSSIQYTHWHPKIHEIPAKIHSNLCIYLCYIMLYPLHKHT